MQNFNDSYKSSGVDINAGYKAVELMKKSVNKTLTKSVLSGIGGFGGLFELNLDYIKNPVLVSGTDGVGTKLKLAFLLNKHDTIGIDCVAMCVNDVICSGAKPLFFLDYVAVGKNYPEKVAEIVSGVANGCLQSGCSLIGGETAEMPGFYPVDEYDLAGFCVGIVDKNKILDNKNVKPSDVIIALPSSGVHSNGFSLVRKIFGIENIDVNKKYEFIDHPLLAELITPSKIYVNPVLSLLKKVNVKSISHITGGGFYENIPRALSENTRARVFIDKIKVLPIFKLIQKIGNIQSISHITGGGFYENIPRALSENTRARVFIDKIKVLPIFKLIQKIGNIPLNDMFSTFNMGVGMCIIVSKDSVELSMDILKENGEEPYIIGEILEGENGIDLC